jgi:peptidoglycan-associated lipoprotein
MRQRGRLIVTLCVFLTAACGKKTPPAAAPSAPPTASAPESPAVPDPPAPPEAPAALSEDEIFARKTLSELNAERPLVTIEGHCDERGSSEYNLALGDRRAGAVRSYLVSLGIAPERLLVVSKGKESPFCAEGHEDCWQQNRRGHFIITAK